MNQSSSRTVVFMDFDKFAEYTCDSLLSFHAALLKRLEADRVVSSGLHVHTIALGLQQSFKGSGVTSALTSMCVDMRLVSDAQHEDTARALERAAMEYAKDTAVEAIVIVSPYVNFNVLMRGPAPCEQACVHCAPCAAGALAARSCCRSFATKAYHVQDVFNTTQAANPASEPHIVQQPVLLPPCRPMLAAHGSHAAPHSVQHGIFNKHTSLQCCF